MTDALARCCCQHARVDHDPRCRWLHCDCEGWHTLAEQHPDAIPIADAEPTDD